MADLKSCVTLDIEHFHANTNYKTLAKAMMPYCRSFGESMKENVEKLSNWAPTTFQIILAGISLG